MTYDGFSCYFSFWAIFCPFTPLAAQKIKIKKNEKNTQRHLHFIYLSPSLSIYSYKPYRRCVEKNIKLKNPFL